MSPGPLQIVQGGWSALATPGGFLLAAIVTVAALAWPGEPSRRAVTLGIGSFVAGFAIMTVARHPLLAPMPRPLVGLLASDGVALSASLPALLWLGLGLLRGRPAPRHPGFYGLTVGLGCAAIWVAEQGPVLAQLGFRTGGWWLYVLSLAMGLSMLGVLTRWVVRRPGRWGVGAAWMLVALAVGLMVGAYQRVALESLLRWPLSGGG